jgi:hypothetical protein
MDDSAVAVGAAAIIIASNGAYDGPITLIAASAPIPDDIAGMASEISGRTIARVVVDDDEWVAAQIAAVRPEMMARFTFGMYQAAREGFFAGVDPLLGTLLGREPVSARAALEATAV